MKGKKAQEEIVGFVLIIVLIAVIAVIFLGIELRKPSSGVSQQSDRVLSFLSALSKVTTSCEDSGRPLDISHLMTACSSSLLCDDGISSCEILETTLKEIINTSYIVTSESQFRNYNLTISRSFDNTLLIKPIFSGVENCPTTKIFNSQDLAVSSGENIVINLEICLRS